jgi:2-polyprenyl-3-methyl-5-hydroxy-6-metoxy-1,4-benzoquinol methylase
LKPKSTTASKYQCEKNLAIDCGAGIGRITKHLLLKNFQNVEMVDVTPNFIAEASKYLGENDLKRVSKFHCCGLQKFYPEINKYDCIWIQWVAGDCNFYLLDFLKIK